MPEPVIEQGNGAAGPQGWLRGSGLDAVRQSADELSGASRSGFVLVDSRLEVHVTPAGKDQQFLYCVFRRVG